MSRQLTISLLLAGGCFTPERLSAGTDHNASDESSGGSDDSVDAADDSSTGTDAPVSRAVDILFVIDNSGSMGEEQRRLVDASKTLIDVLDGAGLDWRIGFTTTDNGNPWCGSTFPEVGKLQLSSCRERTGEFVFNGNPPADATATACSEVCGADTIEVLPTTTAEDPQPWRRPWLERTGGVLNVDLGAVEAFACAAPQGIAGCGFESPLEALYKALLRANNSDDEQYGFLRREATLVVVLVTDETDCSYNSDYESIFLPTADGGNPEAFWSDPSTNVPTSAVCWNAGVACSGSGTPYTECHATNKNIYGDQEVSDDDAVLHPVGRYADYLQSLEDEKRQYSPNAAVILAVIGGVAPGYEKGGAQIFERSDDPLQQQDFGIAPVCGSVDGPTLAIPAVRERELAEQFEIDAKRNVWSVCDPSYLPAFGDLAAKILAAVAPD